jgi:hypothetical protein
VLKHWRLLSSQWLPAVLQDNSCIRSSRRPEGCMPSPLAPDAPDWCVPWTITNLLPAPPMVAVVQACMT